MRAATLLILLSTIVSICVNKKDVFKKIAQNNEAKYAAIAGSVSFGIILTIRTYLNYHLIFTQVEIIFLALFSIFLGCTTAFCLVLFVTINAEEYWENRSDVAFIMGIFALCSSAGFLFLDRLTQYYN